MSKGTVQLHKNVSAKVSVKSSWVVERQLLSREPSAAGEVTHLSHGVIIADAFEEDSPLSGKKFQCHIRRNIKNLQPSPRLDPPPSADFVHKIKLGPPHPKKKEKEI